MSAFREAIAREVRKELLNPEFDARRSKNGGRVFWVRKSTSANFAQFVKEHPPYDDNIAAVHETMSAAAGAVVADRGDEVRVGIGHTETFTKTFSLTTAGVRWVGEGQGTKAPLLTISGAMHGVRLSGAGMEFENFRFPVPEVDETLSAVRISGAGIKVKDIVGVASGVSANNARETNFVDCITVIAGADDLRMDNIKWTAANTPVPGTFLTFEGAISRFASAGFYASGSVGTAGVVDDANARLKEAIIEDWVIAVGGSAKPALTLDATGGKGIVRNSFFAGTNTTLANNGQFVGDWRLVDVKLLEETGNVAQGALIPAVDSE